MFWAGYIDRIKRYFALSKTEWKSFFLLTVIWALMLSFTKWGETSFDAALGFRNLLLAVIIVGVSVFVHHAAQRLMGLSYGYRIEHRIWWAGLLGGLLALLLSNGRILIFAASTMHAHFMPIHRLGAFRYGPSTRQIGASAFTGPIVSVIFGFLMYAISPTVFADLLRFNLLFAVYSMIPIPPLDGILVFIGSNSPQGGGFAYKFLICALIGYFLVFFLTGIGFLWSIPLAVIIGLVGWALIDVIAIGMMRKR